MASVWPTNDAHAAATWRASSASSGADGAPVVARSAGCTGAALHAAHSCARGPLGTVGAVHDPGWALSPFRCEGAAPKVVQTRGGHREGAYVRIPARPTGTTGEGRFELSDVGVSFGGVVALSEVSLEVAPRQVLGVIGPNGAGKTTLFNVACGFVTPDRGTIRWRGVTLRRLRPHQLAGLGIARTLQAMGLFDRMSVLDNVMVGADRHAATGFGSALLALPRSARDERRLRDRAMAVLDELGAASYAGRLPPSLPYAMRKRVSLARALVSNPDLLLLDEPASGLSQGEMAEFGSVLRGLTERMAVLLVEHHMDLVLSVCDEIAVLDFGRLIARGAPDDVRSDPAVLAAYLGVEVREGAASPGGREDNSARSA
ncbi:MAG: ATP-binding cassette domain-containing protein [Propionibacteriales bacterium]|nr:ATP-binding cassette domain-containing protein [Propionibacteriales bacterium]